MPIAIYAEVSGYFFNEELNTGGKFLKPPEVGQLWELAKHGVVPVDLIRSNEKSTLEDFYSVIDRRKQAFFTKVASQSQREQS